MIKINFVQKIINWIQKDKKIIAVSLCSGLLITAAAGIYHTKAYSETIQTGIADSVVRFHVLANSDTQEDQGLKLQVRNAVLSSMKERMETCETKEETKEVLSASLEEIKETALKEIHKNGFDYTVKVFLSKDLFPVKTYGTITFPGGMYDALRIEIGEAQGRNWWCVMFPPMCFVDAACEEVTQESKTKLKGVLSTEEYEIVASADTPKQLTPQIKFKIVEWWQEKKAEGKHYVTKK